MPTRLFQTIILACAVTVAASLGTSTAAEARKYRGGYVTVESAWGNGSISAPVRYSRRGPQVRLPRGTWIYCVRRCSETLRRQTVDFWESHGPNAIDAGPGYLRFFFGR